MIEDNFAKLCGEVCRDAFRRNDFTNLKQLVASPEFQLSVELARIQELVSKQNREALKLTIKKFNGGISWH